MHRDHRERTRQVYRSGEPPDQLPGGSEAPQHVTVFKDAAYTAPPLSPLGRKLVGVDPW